MDLRDVHQDLWDAWARREDEVHSADTGSEKQEAELISRKTLRQDLKVVTDLSLFFSLNKDQTYVLQWTQKKKAL